MYWTKAKVKYFVDLLTFTCLFKTSRDTTRRMKTICQQHSKKKRIHLAILRQSYCYVFGAFTIMLELPFLLFSSFIIFDHLSPIFLELIVIFAIARSLLFVVEIVSNMFKLTIKFRIHSLYNNLNLVLIANSLL